MKRHTVRRKWKEEIKKYAEDEENEDESDEDQPKLKMEQVQKKKKTKETNCNQGPSINISNKTTSILSKSVTKEQFLTLAGIEETDSLWTKLEEEQLIELYKAVGNDWASIEKFIKQHSAESIKIHLMNILRWAAYEYKTDYDWNLKKLTKIFTNHDELYIQNPLTENDENLQKLIEVACYLLNIEFNIKDETCASNSVNEKDKLRDIWKRKVTEKRDSKRRNSFKNPLFKSSEENSNEIIESTINKFKWKGKINNEWSESPCNSDSSEIDLLLNLS